MIKVYLVIGLGYVVGEVKHDYKTKVVLENAGCPKLVNTERGLSMVVQEPIAPFVQREETLPIARQFIVYEGDPDEQLKQVYRNYTRELVKKRSGIEMVPAGAMKNIPFPKGRLQ